MWEAGAGFSSERDATQAGRAAAEQALARCGKAEAALLFAGPEHRRDAAQLLAAVAEVLGTRRIAGGLAHGVLGPGVALEGGTGVSLLAVRGLEAHPLWLPDLSGHEDLVAEEVAAALDGAPRSEDLVVLVPDPAALNPEKLLQSIREVVGPAGVVGAGAGDPVSGAPLVWCDSRIAGGALSGLVLRGARALRVGVTQACRPATPLLTVTRAQGPWILELDGRPALEVYREAAGAPLAADLPRAAAFVLAALPRSASDPLAPGGYRVRNIAGFAPEANAFAIPEAVARGDRIALVHREPETAREDLKAMLAGLAAGAGAPPRAPGLALYFDCCARGASFFGVPGLESAYLERALCGAPFAGMFGSCEIGPIGGSAELLTYTGVLALLD